MAKHRKSSSTTHASTPALAQLEQAHIAYQLHEYEHDSEHMHDGYGLEAAAKLGIDPHRVCKTLMADLGGELVTAVVPVSGHLDMKALAHACGAKKAHLAEAQQAMRETGYVVGGISPLGHRSPHHTVLDAQAAQYPTILVSGGKRGTSIELAPQDLVSVLQADIAPIATW